MWLLFSIVTVVLWGTGGFLYKLGNNYDEKFTSLKTLVNIGFFFGLYVLIYYIIILRFEYDFKSFFLYLPISFAYIFSMWLSYVGLRYLTVSISSPISNASGGFVSLCLVIFGGERLPVIAWGAIILITLGIILIGKFEDHSRLDNKSKLSPLALLFPIGYMIFDSIGTFLDGIVLDVGKINLFGKTFVWVLDEDNAQFSYMLSFFIVGVVCFIFLTFVKKERWHFHTERPRMFAAIFETLGQVTYVFAMSKMAVLSAPIIASFSVISVILGQIFLKERFKAIVYIAIIMIIVGTIVLGVFDY